MARHACHNDRVVDSVASGSGRRQGKVPRTVRSAVMSAVAVAREAGVLTAADEPLAVLAVKMAGQFDHAASEKRAGEVVRLGKELRELLADLPLRGEGATGDAGDAVEWDADAELAKLARSGPTLGDSA